MQKAARYVISAALSLCLIGSAAAGPYRNRASASLAQTRAPSRSIRFDLGLSGLTFQLPGKPKLVKHETLDGLGEVRYFEASFGGLRFHGGGFSLIPGRKFDVQRQAKVNANASIVQLNLSAPKSFMLDKRPLG